MPLAIPTGFMDGAAPFIPTGDSPPDSTNLRSSMPGSKTVDGTPARVAAIGVLSVAVIVGLRWAGIKFNVAVST